jgi:putative transposase
MPRKPRLYVPGGFYHVILRGNGRNDIFFEPRDRGLWQFLLQKGLARYDHRVHAYCWMTNHIHMIVQAGSTPISNFMGFVSSTYARSINFKLRRPGHLFERRHKAILIQEDRYLKELVRYIHMNPIRADIANDLDQYPWSSHHFYAGRETSDWLTLDFVLAMFGASNLKAHQNYRKFVNEESQLNLKVWLNNENAQDDRLFGDDDWASRILTQLGERNKRTLKTLDQLINIACEKHNVSEAELASASRIRRFSAIRTEIALAATEARVATLTEVARLFGRAHSGLSRAVNRLRDHGK